jgi:hypothetical protein
MSTKRFVFSLFVSILLLAPASSMYAMRSQMVCGWVQYWYIDSSGSYNEFWVYGCWEEIVVEADPPPPDPQPQPPSPSPVPQPDPGGGTIIFPQVSIVGYSTTIPNSPTLRVEYNSSVAEIQLYVDGQVTATQYPPNSIFVLPSLDSLSGDYHSIEVWVADAGLGHRSSAGCTLSQFDKTASNQSTFEVFYLLRVGGGEVDLPVKSKYYRTFAGNIRQTTFGGAGFAEGPDNGHNKYSVVEDAFKAEYNSLYYVPNSLATIDVDFQMTPYFGSLTASPLGNTCDSASVFPVDVLTQWRCGRIDEYASPYAQAGTAVIQAAEPATYAYGSGFVFFGDKTLTIFP